MFRHLILLTVKAYISWGPTCVPAEILKASKLRACTFGFDWFRSGSYFVEENLRMPLDVSKCICI